MSSPCWPFQITSVFWKCSTNRPYAVTLSPLTTMPVSAVLAVQPTPLPWSARQIHTSSSSTLSLLTTRLVVALPGVAPPTRKNTSNNAVGLSAAPPCDFGERSSSSKSRSSSWPLPLPTCSSTRELTVPASKRRP